MNGYGILDEIDGKIRHLLVPRATGFSFGERGIAPAVGSATKKRKTAALYGR